VARSELASIVENLEQQLLAVIAASEADNADDEHDPEGATIAFERAHVASILATTRERLGEIDQALQRFSTDRYGVCTICGNPIGAARLEARPAASACLRCASKR
jgi:RNA polymerase-binding transcription factor DksA